MTDDTASLLDALNRTFYEARAREFSDSRGHAWPGWRRVTDRLHALRADGESERLRVLDVGCGNARFAQFIRTAWKGPLHYVGVDTSPALLAIAKAETANLPSTVVELVDGDVLNPAVGALPGDDRYDLVVAFGLLHHIPGRLRRRALFAQLLQHAKKDGLIVVTAWRFLSTGRFEGRIVPWESYNKVAAEPISLEDLDAGDRLLRFGNDEGPLRYCHACDEDELLDLLKDLPLRTIESFDADGRSGDLNHYILFQRT
jgi:tRNA (uracil-5-)-methyltransferase TRM9